MKKLPINLKEHLAKKEKDYIREALLDTGGNISAAARLLCLNRTTLTEKLRKYGLHCYRKGNSYD